MTLERQSPFVPAAIELWLSVVGLILLIAVIPAAAQVPTGSVQGRVICSDGNVPAREANVQLVPLASLLQQSAAKAAEEQPLGDRADFDGNYVISVVPVGTYVVDASKAGYSSEFDLVSAALSRFTLDERKKLLANFPQVTVEAGTAATENVVIHRGAAIMGRVIVDIGGVPAETSVVATMVSSDLLDDVAGSEGAKPPDFVMGGSTDDRGKYRIAGLPAGKYRIVVRLIESYYHLFFSDGKPAVGPTRTGSGQLTVFAPDALEESRATLVNVGDGDEVSDVDIMIPMRLLHSISGTVTQGGVPLAGAYLAIFRHGKKVGTSNVLSLSDGSYQFNFLPAGSYTVRAQYPVKASGHSGTAEATIQISDDDITDVNIDLPAAGQTR
jgi:hypothetical protein